MARQAQRAGWVLLVLSSAGLLAAAEPATTVRVGRAAGTLAVQEEGSSAWRMVSQGDALPADCALRTASAAPCLVELPGGTLHLDADTRARLNLPKRRMDIDSGRIFLRTGVEAGPWTIAKGNLELLAVGGSAVEVAAPADGKPASIAVAQGSASATRGPDTPATIAAGHRAAWNGEKRSIEMAAMSAEEQERLGRWTAAPKPAQGLGQLVIKDAQAGSPTRLDVARYHVNVVLQPPVALVQIDQTFYNPSFRQEEGTFVFNLPRGASVSRFAMYVTRQELIEGELIERQRAANIYQTIVNQRRDPAILEQIGENLFKMRVFPIFPRDTKRILLDFTLPLEEHLQLPATKYVHAIRRLIHLGDTS